MSVENLIRLAATGERLLANPDLPIGFGKIDCGTFACLLGWYVRDYGATDLIRGSLTDKDHANYYSTPDVTRHFGITAEQSDELFLAASDLNDMLDDEERVGPEIDEMADVPGDAARTELIRRLAIVRNLISSRER